MSQYGSGRASDSRSRGGGLESHPLYGPGQAAHAYLPLSSSSIIWYYWRWCSEARARAWKSRVIGSADPPPLKKIRSWGQKLHMLLTFVSCLNKCTYHLHLSPSKDIRICINNQHDFEVGVKSTVSCYMIKLDVWLRLPCWKMVSACLGYIGRQL